MLRAENIEVVWAESGSEGIKTYAKNIHAFASVFIDYVLPDLKGSEVGQHIRKLNPDQDIVFASGFRDPEYLIDLLQTGVARTFLSKGRPSEELKSIFLEAISTYRNENRIIGFDEYEPAKAELELRNEGFISKSKVMIEMLELIRIYRESTYPVLIVGETGTGKELIARALTPKGKKIIVVDCPGFDRREATFESELFGYMKGAFTGADKDTPGLLSQAHEQVLFLDEFHLLSVTSQRKLLRFLQEMKYRRVGDHTGREIPINFRLIAACKPEIYDKVGSGEFALDLMHRVAQHVIQVPTLKERGIDDHELLVRHIQDEFNADKPVEKRKQFHILTIREMAQHNWTGNIREFISVVRDMLVLCPSTETIIRSEQFQLHLKRKPNLAIVKTNQNLTEVSKEAERKVIIEALQEAHTKQKAAENLKVSRFSLKRKLERLGIDADAYLNRSLTKGVSK